MASYRSATDGGSVDFETGTHVPVVLADKAGDGRLLTFASAAAVTLGPFALPVYEIYKVGQALHWLEGLDLMASIGLPAVVIPHFDNAEGGDARHPVLLHG